MKVARKNVINMDIVLKRIKRDRYYLILLVLPFLYFVIFKYIPILGNVIAFRRYKPGLSIFGSSWVGLKYFNMFLADPSFWLAFKNSFILSLLGLAVNFPIPIILALLINEIRNPLFKRLTQTISYLPRFISTVVVIGILREILSPSGGIVNIVLENFGVPPTFFMNEPKWYRLIYILSDTWQFAGWSAIIYLAAITNINVELYDSAMIDGANRFKQLFNVTIPGIMPTVSVIFILSVGNMLTKGFDKSVLLYTPVNSPTSDIIETFVYRMGLVQNSYSYSTAVGLFGSALSFVLLYTANFLSKKYSENSLF